MRIIERLCLGRPCWVRCDPCCHVGSALKKGDTVQVLKDGLKSKPELNEMTGKVASLPATGRIGIQFGHLPKPIALKRSCLAK